MTLPFATTGSLFCWIETRKPAFCSWLSAISAERLRTSGTATWAAVEPGPSDHRKTPTIPTTATAAMPSSTFLSTEPLPESSAGAPAEPTGATRLCRPVLLSTESISVVRSSSVITIGALGRCPLSTRIRSLRISAADW